MKYPLKTWHFDTRNDPLVNLVLAHQKTAFTFLYDENAVPVVGEEAVLLFDNEKKACVTKTTKVVITKFKDLPASLSRLEGEGPFEKWKESRIRAFKRVDPAFCEDTKVVVKVFEVTRNLVEERLELARNIARANRDLLGEPRQIYEINAGYNNSIFCVNEKYILKVCGDEEKEGLFDVEANFYRANQDSENLPFLYRYDKSKKAAPCVYEILERIKGKSVYYHWYKMDEPQREALIRELAKVLKKLHAQTYPAYDWGAFVKEQVLENFRKTQDLFCWEEKALLLASFEKYGQILSDNTFCLVHNDLHFDNILLDEENRIKLIDFNDSFIAPFDFDFRLLYISVSLPWKWANTEMDPLQKPQDYQNLFSYLKKYDPRLRDVKYLEERMLVYWVLNDFSLLPRFRDKEGKEQILLNSQKILDAEP